MLKAQRDALAKEVQTMRAYAESLPAGEERDQMNAALADAEGELKAYAAKEPAPDPADDATDPSDDAGDETDNDDEEDGTTDPELESIIESMRGEGYDVADDGDEDSPDAASDTAAAKDAPAKPAAKTYAEERLERLQVEQIDRGIDGAVAAGKLLPPQAAVYRRVCYTLAGVEPGGQSLKAYAEDERESAVSELLATINAAADIGLLKSYTTDSHQGTEAKRQVLELAPVVNGKAVNEDSIDLSAKIKKYAEDNKITDFGTAAVAYERANKGTIRRYGEKE